jgi:hypothetical protein
MTPMQWALVGLCWLALGVPLVNWLRWNTRLPLPRQSVVAIARRGVRLDVSEALERAGVGGR